LIWSLSLASCSKRHGNGETKLKALKCGIKGKATEMDQEIWQIRKRFLIFFQLG